MHLSAGTRLGPYEILTPLGAGGMGEVYKARDTRLERTIAVKILAADVAADPQRRERFKREARAISSLTHPHICALYDVGSQDGLDFLVMEHLSGETLAHRLLRGPLPIDDVLRIGAQLADALDAAHRQGVIHRDLKPGNVMLTASGAKILDFGLAKRHGTDSERAMSAGAITVHPTLTQVGTIVGTIQYMAPEQVEDYPADARADLFALGAILYEMITGRKAFEGAGASSVMAAILTSMPPPTTTLQPVTPPALDRLVRKCLAKDPDKRWQTAADLRDELAWIGEQQHSMTSSAAVPEAGSPRRGRRTAFLLALATLTVAAIAILVRQQIGVRTAGGATLPSVPSFRPLTFRRGHISNARFAPDGQTIVYTAAWDGRPYDTFATRADMPESRSLGFPSGSILAISSGGEMAISLGCAPQGLSGCEGTLARVPLAGGAPREILEHVKSADWSADGSALAAVVTESSGVHRLEYPLGHVVTRTSDIDTLELSRLSPRGDLLAFFEFLGGAGHHPGGSLIIVDGAGKKTTLARGYGITSGLAWSPTGDEVWFSGLKNDAGTGGWGIYAASLSGRERVIWRSFGFPVLADVDRQGRALVLSVNGRNSAVAGIAGEPRERDLSWFLWSLVDDMSPDGKVVLLTDLNYGAGGEYGIYLRKMDGSAPVRLADGQNGALSPDGKAVLAVSPRNDKLAVIPTGAGSVHTLNAGSIEMYDRAAWLPDQKRIVFSAKERSHGWRCYVQDVLGAPPRPITPEGVETQSITRIVISSDGKYVVAEPDSSEIPAFYPVDGGPPRPIPGVLAHDDPVQRSDDGRFLYVRVSTSLLARVFRIDLTNGRRELWKELAPNDPAGVLRIGRVRLTPDGETYAYNYLRNLSELFLVEGFK